MTIAGYFRENEALYGGFWPGRFFNFLVYPHGNQQEDANARQVTTQVQRQEASGPIPQGEAPREKAQEVERQSLWWRHGGRLTLGVGSPNVTKDHGAGNAGKGVKSDCAGPRGTRRYRCPAREDRRVAGPGGARRGR